MGQWVTPVSCALFENNIRQGFPGAMDSILELLKMIVWDEREKGNSCLGHEF